MFNIQFITDYNNSILENLFEKKIQNKNVNVIKSQFKQTIKYLSKPIKSKNKNIRYIEINIDTVLNKYSNKIFFKNNEINIIKKQLDNIINLILLNNNLYELTIISLLNDFRTSHNINNYKYKTGRNYLESELNLSLMKKLSPIENIILVNPKDFITENNKNEIEKVWYNTKTPYSIQNSKILIENIYNVLDQFFENKKKLIICDLDNTLWGGILGDDGIENIILGGHSAKGEAFKDFQRYLKELKDNGIILALCSKNDETNAIEAINTHPEMVLSSEDFVLLKINWVDKAKNIFDILNELNLHEADAIFLDDSKSERNRVRSVFPNMLVPELPENNVLYSKILKNLNCFNFDLTIEDKKRTTMYKQNAAREKEEKSFTNKYSYKDWLKSLKLELKVEDLNNINSKRALQLINKTNQMNFCTNRYSEYEFNKLKKNKNFHIFTFSVKDKFGDYGLTGVLVLNLLKNKIIINDFVLSCRVFGKFIENSMLEFINLICINKKIEQFSCIFKKNKRNTPSTDFLEKTNFSSNKKNVFLWNTNSILKFPKFIKIFYKNQIVNDSYQYKQ